MMAADSSKFRRRRRREEKAFFCQVETYFGTKEYARHGRCVRLIGIGESDFHDGIDDLLAIASRKTFVEKTALNAICYLND